MIPYKFRQCQKIEISLHFVIWPMTKKKTRKAKCSFPKIVFTEWNAKDGKIVFDFINTERKKKL